MKPNITLLMTSVLLFSCTQSYEDVQSEELPSKTPLSIHEAERRSGLPFENINTLRSLNKERLNVDYSLSRKAALLEMEDFKELFLKENPKGGFKLSERPIVIRDANNEAKLYEYIVFNSELKPIATITNFAKQEANDFSAFVLPYVRSYKSKLSQTFSLEYPYDGNIQENTELRNLKLDTLDTSKFWKKAEDWGKKLDGKTDTELINIHKKELRGWFSNKTEWYTIPQFDRENLKRTRFSGACGPAALAWVYRGFYPTFKGNYIPLHGESPSDLYNLHPSGDVSYYRDDNPLMEAFNEGLGMSILFSIHFKDAMSPKKFADMVDKYFPDYKISSYFSLKGAPRREIQNGNPVYMVVFANSELHYIIGFGTKDKYTWFGFHNDSWIYVTDNGATTSSYGYMPYYRNSHFFNFANKYVSMGAFIRK